MIHLVRASSSLLFLLATSGPLFAKDDVPPAAKAPADAAGTFLIQSVRTGPTSFTILRMNERSGRAWYMNRGAWVELKESGALPPAHYSVETIPLDGTWGAIRHDATNGHTWVVDNGKWQAISEEPILADIPSGAKAPGGSGGPPP